MRKNGWQLPAGGNLEALHCQPNINFDININLDLTNEPLLLGRCCYKQLYSLGKIFRICPVNFMLYTFSMSNKLSPMIFLIAPKL